ncbi:hypothetical protein D3C80_1595760 [compost metagenome]
MVIGNQRPVVNANRHIRQRDIRLRPLRQLFHSAPQVVTEQPECAPLKRQVGICRGMPPLSFQLFLQQAERVFLRLSVILTAANLGDLSSCGERCAGIRDQNIETVMRVLGKPGVQQHCPRLLSKRSKVLQQGGTGVRQRLKIRCGCAHGPQ